MSERKKIEQRISEVKRQIEHSKLKYIIFQTFSRNVKEHYFRYVASDIIQYSNGSRINSWDLLLLDESKINQHIFQPIFIEVKSSIGNKRNPKDTVNEMLTKASLTETLLNKPQGRELILGQIVSNRSEIDQIKIGNPEYVIFLPGSDGRKLLNNIMTSNSTYTTITKMIIWSYDSLDTSDHCIQIPYMDTNNVDNCSKCAQVVTKGKLCLCVHFDKGIMKWIRNRRNQKLSPPGLMPSHSDFGDRIINILAFVSSGYISKDKQYTIADLRKEIERMYAYFKISQIQENSINLANLLIKGKIFLPQKGDLKTFHLNSSIIAKIRNQDELLYEITKRTIKYSLSSVQRTLA